MTSACSPLGRPSIRHFFGVAAAAAAAMLLATAPSLGAQSPEEVMETMAELDIEFMGIAVDIPDRQNLGRREATRDDDERGVVTNQGTIVYAWDAEKTPDDATAREYLLSIDHLRVAGIPAVPGTKPDMDRAYGGQRYRLGGTLTGLEIGGDQRYEVRANLAWQLYDASTSSVVWEGTSSAMARGAALGVRGESDNVLLDAVIKAADSVLEEDIPEAIEENE